LSRLYELGAIRRDSTPTKVGFIMNKFRFLSIESIAMILSGYAWDVSIVDLITIAAYLNTSIRPGFFMRGRTFQDDPFQNAIDRGDFKFPWFLSNAYRTQLMLSCDFMWGLLIWYNYQFVLSESKITLKDWCESVGISYAKMNDMIEFRDDILQMMSAIGLNPYKNFSNGFSYIDSSDLEPWIRSIKQCIMEGYKSNIAVWHDTEHTYKTKLGRIPIVVERKWLNSSSESYTYGVQNPKYIV